jgi:phage terminase Nu1 subunit (DNA packaging protein)
MQQVELAGLLGITKGQLSKWKAKGLPVDDEGKARTWIRQNIRTRAKRNGAPAAPVVTQSKDLPPPETPPVPESYSWEARLARARKIELDVFDAAQRALNQGEAVRLQNLLSAYVKSLAGIAEAEKTALEARIQSGELLHRDTVRAILGELLVPIRNALDLLPMTERTRCNPQSPEVAEGALRQWKDALLLRLSTSESKV